MTTDVALDPFASGGTPHPNPVFDYLTGFVPRKLKDLLRWAEYLSYNSAHIYGVIRKFGEYPITRFVYDSPSPLLKGRHKNLFEKILRLKGFLTKVSFDKYVYGNVFTSVYFPIKRMLACSVCATREDIKSADYKFTPNSCVFTLNCRHCQHIGPAEVIDEKLLDPSKISLIRWDPKLIDIDFNPVTNQSVYYYTIPRFLVQQVRAGNKHIISHMPLEMLKAMRDRQTFRFAEGQIYHMKEPGPAGVEAQWGIPPITSAIKLFLFAAILRRANEAIALEHITPFRVIHPATASSNADPSLSMNLTDWRQEIERNYKLFRKDPLRMQFSPIPVGVQNIGGDGRAMLTIGELQEAEKNIVLSLGVPLEFLTGGLGQTRGEITLRIIENQLQTHVEDLNGLVVWLEDQISQFMGWASIPMRLADFKMIDDVDNKNMIFELWKQGKVSDSRIAETLNLDFDTERKQIQEEQLTQAKAEAEMQAKLTKQQNSLSNRARQGAQAAQGGAQYDQQAIIAQADQIAQQLSQLDGGTIRSRMDALKTEDMIMYSVVRERMEQMQQDEAQAAKAQARAQ